MKFDLIARHKWLRRVLWCVVGVLVLWALGWLALPPLLRSQGERIGSAQLGRQVTIGHVGLKPWSLELVVDDVAIAGAAGASAAADTAATPPQLQIKRIYIDAALLSLVRLAPVVDAISIEEPKVRLTRLGAGRYDIDDILTRLSAPSDKPAGEPMHFALYNLELKGGSIDFNDEAIGKKTHAVRDLRLAVPFLSNLDSQREIKVEPHLAFQFNGSRFDSAAQTTPFAASRKTDASFKLVDFDLTPYLGYLPDSLPLKLQAGALQADLRLQFEQQPKLSVKLSGVVQADHIKLADAAGGDAVAFDTLKVVLEDVRPLEQLVKLSALELTAPQIAVRRDAAGRLNLLGPVQAAPTSVAAEKAATPASAASAAGNKGPATNVAAPVWRLELAKLSLKSGALRWTDEAAMLQGKPASVVLRDMGLEASAISWPFANDTPPMQFEGSAALDAAVPVAASPSKAGTQPATKAGAEKAAAQVAAPLPVGPITFKGSATDKAAALHASVGGVPLSIVAPYLAAFIEPRLAGQLSAEVDVDWKAPDALKIDARQFALDGLALTGTTAASGKAAAPTATLASIRKLQLTQASVDLAQRSVRVGQISVTQPMAKVERGSDQRWMFETWLKTQPAAAGATSKSPNAPNAPKPAAPGKSAAAAPWRVAIADLAVDGGNVAVLDRAAAVPVAFEVTGLQVQMKNIAPDSATPSPLTVEARIRAGQTEPGRLSYRGTVALQPLAAQGQVDVKQLPLHAFEPYFGAALNIDLIRADTSFKGQLRFAASPAGPTLKLTGDTTLEEFRANSAAVVASASVPATVASAASAAATPATPAEPAAAAVAARGRELLSWKMLNLRGLDVAMAPGKPTAVEVKETALTDFYARVIVNENGRINLQDLVKSADPASTPAAAAGTAPPASAPVARVAPAPSTSASAAAPVRSASADAAAGPAAVVRFGPISLVNGRVLFSDRFVKPNYTANLSELTGKLSAFSSVQPTGAPQLADLELRGRAEGTASLEILGKLNPLAKPLALDVTGKVRDLELPPLSPYTVKYVGHGIERGKMSVDVHYVIQPDGQLTATNSIILNQLTFGEPVAGAPTSLPVKLAVALLADRNGVIDLNLPLSGSLNDPQFRIGPVIFKIIGNLIVKAVTAPFSLLASAFGGGGQELSEVAFAPGSAQLSAEAQQGLDKVAKALADRPSLKMTVIGTSSLEAEREAYKRERLQRMVRAEKRRNSVVAGNTGGNASAQASSAAADGTADITVSAAEYPELLKAVYKRADFPKPRNLIGLAKDLPVKEMEDLLLANQQVSEQQMHQLAVQRGVVVRDYLAAQKLPLERLFLGAPKDVGSDTKWTPRADLTLATP